MMKTIELGNLSAKINIIGGEIKSLTKNGVEYIWQGDPQFWESSTPVLFPVVGRLRNKVLTVDGVDYPMPMHGFVRTTELKVIEHTENSITFCLEDNAETKKMYPWSFRYEAKYTLTETGLINEFKVVNTDDKEMIFGLGGHPGFKAPIFDGEKFEDYQLVFEKEEELWSNHVSEEESICAEKKDLILSEGNTIPLKRSLFNNDAMIFEDIKSNWVNLVHKDTKKGLHFDYTGFPVLAIWTREEPFDAPYVCLEPWFGMGFRDNEGSDINEKYGMQRLAPGKEFVASFTMDIID